MSAWEEIKNLGSKRTPGDWRFKTYKPGGAPEYEDQFYDWWIDDGEIRICSHEATNHRNGKFIVELVNAWPKIERVVDASRHLYQDISKTVDLKESDWRDTKTEINRAVSTVVSGGALMAFNDALEDLGAVE